MPTLPMSPLDLVMLTPLMRLTAGRPNVVIGLIDGPVSMESADLSTESVRQLRGDKAAACAMADSVACMHGTFVAGILSAKRSSRAPAICPGCTLLVRPIFQESVSESGQIPSATADELANAITDSIDAGARILNMSVGLIRPSMRSERKLQEALDYAVERRVIAVAAAGNQGEVGSSPITRHAAVIPVVACDREGRPMAGSNIGNTIGRRGLRGPGTEIVSLGTGGIPQSFDGTSAATPFVTGTIALLWSEFPDATAHEVRLAVTQIAERRRTAVVPPLLDAWAAYRVLARVNMDRRGDGGQS